MRMKPKEPGNSERSKMMKVELKHKKQNEKNWKSN